MSEKKLIHFKENFITLYRRFRICKLNFGIVKLNYFINFRYQKTKFYQIDLSKKKIQYSFLKQFNKKIL